MPLNIPPISVSLSGNTAGTMALVSSGTLFLAGGNNITLSQNNNSVTIVGGAGGGGGFESAGFSTQGNTLGDTGFASQSLHLVGGNNITLSGATAAGQLTLTIVGPAAGAGVLATTGKSVATANSVGTVTRYAAEDHAHEGVYAAGVSNVGNTAGDTGARPGRWVFAGSNGITLSQQTGANSVQTIHVQVGAYLTTAMASNRASDFVAATAAFAGTNASGTIASDGISISVGAGGGGGFGGVGISTQGNTAGTTGFATASYQLVASGGLTLSQSTAANGQYTLTIGAPATTQLTYVAPISLSTAGSTISIMLPGGMASRYEPNLWFSTAASTLGQNSLYIQKMDVQKHVTCDYVMLPIIMTGGWTTSTPVTNSTATTSSSNSASAGQTYTLAIWTQGAGGYSTNLYTYYTTTMTMSTNVAWTQSNSNTTTGTQSIGSTVKYTYGVPFLSSGTLTSVNAGSTVTTWQTSTTNSTHSSTFSTNGTSTSGWPGGTNNATWTGSKIMFLPFATVLTPGLQWFAFVRSSTTGGFAVAGTYSHALCSWTSYDTNSRWAPYGYRTADISTMIHPAGIGDGQLVTQPFNFTSSYVQSGASSGALALSRIAWSTSSDNQSGSWSRFYVKFLASNQGFN